MSIEHMRKYFVNSIEFGDKILSKFQQAPIFQTNVVQWLHLNIANCGKIGENTKKTEHVLIDNHLIFHRTF